MTPQEVKTIEECVKGRFKSREYTVQKILVEPDGHSSDNTYHAYIVATKEPWAKDTEAAATFRKDGVSLVSITPEWTPHGEPSRLVFDDLIRGLKDVRF